MCYVKLTASFGYMVETPFEYRGLTLLLSFDILWVEIHPRTEGLTMPENFVMLS